MILWMDQIDGTVNVLVTNLPCVITLSSLTDKTCCHQTPTATTALTCPPTSPSSRLATITRSCWFQRNSRGCTTTTCSACTTALRRCGVTVSRLSRSTVTCCSRTTTRRSLGRIRAGARSTKVAAPACHLTMTSRASTTWSSRPGYVPNTRRTRPLSKALMKVTLTLT